MKSIQRFVIRQNVKLANNTNEWLSIASFAKEKEAYEAFDEAKIKTKDIALIKISEQVLEE